MINIFSVGKKHEDWIKQGLERYEKRLKRPFDVKWNLLPHSSLSGQEARQEESERIEKLLNPTDFVILLDEAGAMLSSPALSSLLQDNFAHGHSVAIVIGGAYGVNETLKNRAHFIWSLSELVFPHQLVRLILIEQLYRAQSISEGRAYHHE